MSPGPTFDRVYLALKEQLMAARFPPGEHLEPVVLGDELHSSITPIRDALHRLVGERLVEAPRNDGFRVPSLTEAELRDLYGWNRELAELGLRRPPAAGLAPLQPETPVLETSLSDCAAHLFRRIARRSVNPELEDAVEALSDRLAAIRTVEERLFDDAREELDLLCEKLAHGDIAGLRRDLAAYHKKRQRAAPELLVASRPHRDRH